VLVLVDEFTSTVSAHVAVVALPDKAPENIGAVIVFVVPLKVIFALLYIVPLTFTVKGYVPVNEVLIFASVVAVVALPDKAPENVGAVRVPFVV